MKASRIVAISLVAAAGLWIFSGYLIPHESESAAAVRPSEVVAKPFRVGIIESKIAPHSRKLVLSGRTEAVHRVMATSRTAGILTELRVRRGQLVNQGDVLAVLSDEAREAQVVQAEALLTQRKAELDAKRRLIETGALPKLELVNLESQYKAAEAGLAMAEAERDRGLVTAPWPGIITDTTSEVGQAAFSMAGREIAQLASLDPMLAVVEVAERKLAGIKVGDMAEVRLVTGQTATGKIRFVSKSANQSTRTYRVEIEMKNPDTMMPDGITAEVAIPLTSTPATRVPRSALTLSSAGDIGIRAVGTDGKVGFVPVSVVEDENKSIWVAGVPEGTRVIVQGQDFVREGQRVEAVPAVAATAQR